MYCLLNIERMEGNPLPSGEGWDDDAAAAMTFSAVTGGSVDDAGGPSLPLPVVE